MLRGEERGISLYRLVATLFQHLHLSKREYLLYTQMVAGYREKLLI